MRLNFGVRKNQIKERKNADFVHRKMSMSEWDVSAEPTVKQTEIKKKGLTGSALKWIAIITMLIDHTAVALIENGVLTLETAAEVPGKNWNIIYWLIIYWIMRLIGRLGFPIFCFLLVEGFCHTRNVKKYMLRLAVFALISEVPFDLACFKSIFYPNYQNVFFTLLIGVATLCGIRYFNGETVKNRLLRTLCLFAGLAAAYILKTDYNMFGVLLIVVLYMYRDKEIQRDIFAGIVLLCTSLAEITGLLAFIPMHFYNGQRGKQIKYFFYVFYPAHLLILGLIARFLF